MTKPPKTVFVCQECGAQSPKWLGPLRRLRRVELARRGAAAGGVGAAAAPGTATRSAASARGAAVRRHRDRAARRGSSTGIDEFDRVLGGGIVPGSLVLLGGEPGIGKSTLLLQAAANMARTVGPVLYSSGEESEHQIKSRGERLGVGDAPLYLLAETCLERILEEIARIKPALVIVDSIQTVFSLKFQSAPGSIGQVREAATQLLFTAKGQNIPTFLVGHVTKDGSLAGPKALEHVVDTVLYFEGERHHSHRVVRAVKNRFGAVSELGVFEMTSARPAAGAEPVEAVPRRAADRTRRARRCCARSKGSRPILVEVQALVSTQQLRQRAAHGERHRSAAAVAAARGAREARRPEPGGRRRVREHRRRDDASTSRRRTSASLAADRLERPQPRRFRRRPRCSARSAWPARSAASRRRRCACARPRRWASAAASCPRPTSIPSDRATGGRLRAGRRPHGRRSARRASALTSSRQFGASLATPVPAALACLSLSAHTGGLRMAWFALARCLFVAAVAYAAALLQPLAGRSRRQRRVRRSCWPALVVVVREPAPRDAPSPACSARCIGGAIGLADRARHRAPASSGPTPATAASSSCTASS